MAGILTGKLMGSIGRKNLLNLGFVIAAVAMSLFCLGHYWLMGYEYLYLFLGARVLLGLATGMIQATSLSIISSLFPDKVIQMIGYLETGAGLGLSIGPIIGTSLFALYGFNTPYWTFCGLFITMCALCIIVVP